jgi:pentatricopeptide repeat protein
VLQQKFHGENDKRATVPCYNSSDLSVIKSDGRYNACLPNAKRKFSSATTKLQTTERVGRSLFASSNDVTSALKAHFKKQEFEKMKLLVQILEERQSPLLTCQHYNFFLQLFVADTDLIVQRMLAYMPILPKIRPDLTTYRLVLESFVRRGVSVDDMEFVYKKVQEIDDYKDDPGLETLQKIVHSARESQRPAKPWLEKPAPQTIDGTNKALTNFYAMDKPNTDAYNGLCNMHAQNGNVNKVMQLYNKMRSDYESDKNPNCCPDSQTFNIVLNALQKAKYEEAAKQAEEVFRLIPLPNTVSYTTLMSIYAQREYVDKCVDLLRHMQNAFESGANPTCEPNFHTYSTVLAVLGKSKRRDVVPMAETIFQSLATPDTYAYTTMLTVYARRGLVDKCCELLQQMQTSFASGNWRCRPNAHTFATVLSSFAKSKRPEDIHQAEKLFESIPKPDIASYNTLLNVYAKFGAVEKAKALFDGLKEPDSVSFVTLMKLYVDHGQSRDAVDLARRMQTDFDTGANKKCIPNKFARNILVKAVRTAIDPLLEQDAKDVIEEFSKYT